MTNLFALFDQKIYWYKKYLHSNEAFLQALMHAPEIAIEELDFFYGNRESLLKILESLDTKIQKELQSVAPLDSECNSAEVTKIQFYLREKDSIIKRVLELDSQIISSLEAIKAGDEQKLRALTNGKRALSGYKSGDGVTKKIDRRY